MRRGKARVSEAHRPRRKQSPESNPHRQESPDETGRSDFVQGQHERVEGEEKEVYK